MLSCGGWPGAPVHGWVLDREGAVALGCGTGRLAEPIGTGHRVQLTLAGGAGDGDPAAASATGWR